MTKPLHAHACRRRWPRVTSAPSARKLPLTRTASRRGVEAQNHAAACLPAASRRFAQAVQGRHAHAAAHQQRKLRGRHSSSRSASKPLPRPVSRSSAAPGRRRAHGFCVPRRRPPCRSASSACLAGRQSQTLDGAAQVQPVNLHVDELPRPHDGARRRPPGVMRQRAGRATAWHFPITVNRPFFMPPPYASMVEMRQRRFPPARPGAPAPCPAR